MDGLHREIPIILKLGATEAIGSRAGTHIAMETNNWVSKDHTTFDVVMAETKVEEMVMA